jgi:O-methyltransferase
MSNAAADLYIELLKNCLTRYIFIDEQFIPGYTLKQMQELRRNGEDWANTETMIGLMRMNNLRDCTKDVLANSVPGDFIETGVWRGGACIFMRGILKAYNITDRIIWVADSFEGLPKPNAEAYPPDIDNTLWTIPVLSTGLDRVKYNFEKYGLLDDQIRFIKGWFKDTLHVAPIEKLAILRLDGDLYESTIQALLALYPKLSPGGYVIIDDWSLWPCMHAVNCYRNVFNITEPIQVVDSGTLPAAFWKKTQ